jgi:hypothetical protein
LGQPVDGDSCRGPRPLNLHAQPLPFFFFSENPRAWLPAPTTTGFRARSPWFEAWNGTKLAIHTDGPNPARLRRNEVSKRDLLPGDHGPVAAVGYKGTGSSSQPVADRWQNSGAWSLQTVPLPAGCGSARNLTRRRVCTSSTSCRAVGRYTQLRVPLSYWGNGRHLERHDGWSSEAVCPQAHYRSPNTKHAPGTSHAPAVTDCTAVGGYIEIPGRDPGVLCRAAGMEPHGLGRRAPNPAGSSIPRCRPSPVAASSPCVAVGDYLEGTVWESRWRCPGNGTAWVVDSVPFVCGPGPLGCSAGSLLCRKQLSGRSGWYYGRGATTTPSARSNRCRVAIRPARGPPRIAFSGEEGASWGFGCEGESAPTSLRPAIRNVSGSQLVALVPADGLAQSRRGVKGPVKRRDVCQGEEPRFSWRR